VADTADIWHEQDIYGINRAEHANQEERAREVNSRKTTRRKVQKRTRLLSKGLLTNGPLKKAHRDIARDRRRIK
jgi:hypothetical protein